MREFLHQVRLIDPLAKTDRTADLLIEDGVIRAIADTLPPPDSSDDTYIIEGNGLIAAPGLVDLYSRSGEPGHEERETLQSLRRSAAAGGFTRVTILPTTTPALDTPASVAWVYDQVKQPTQTNTRFNSAPKAEAALESEQAAQQTSALPQLYVWGALTVGAQGQQMSELADLAYAGVAGFADGRPLQNLLLVRRLLEYLGPVGLPMALWACDRDLANQGVIREGHDSIQFGLPGVPALAETAALATLLECIAETGTPVHLMRISTARSVELIRQAKQRGLPITASTPWMHLLLNTQAIAHYDPNLKLDPPLGTPADQQALRHAVRDGVIDAIAIDHAAYTYEEKTVAFAEAPAGAIGLQLALPLLWQSLVATGEWSAVQLWRALSLKPAQCLGQIPPQICVDKPAELVLFDPSRPWVVDGRSLQSGSANTPWWGRTISGQIIKTW
jgi:dihydroorotase